jgi:NAD(P)-dependent dehydrogenase (short-subunit alcohol dehydrogenase family)
MAGSAGLTPQHGAAPDERRSALVTGSARGIGLAIAEALAASGHRVTGLDILDQEVGPCAAVVKADLADPAVPQAVIHERGPFDVLVCNAALFIHQPLPEVTLADFDRQVAINFRGTFLLCQAAAPVMAERGWGRIVNISSIGARTGGVSQSAVYNATKAAIISLTKNFARNYGPNGITANAVAPGAVDSFMTQHIIPQYREQYTAEIPVGRFAQPSEIAAVVDFLASERAAFINGAVIDVNGGWLMP